MLHIFYAIGVGNSDGAFRESALFGDSLALALKLCLVLRQGSSPKEVSLLAVKAWWF
jgi:hypothetical protein